MEKVHRVIAVSEPRWSILVLVTLVTGVASGLGGMALALLLRLAQHVAYGHGLHTIVGRASFLQEVSKFELQQPNQVDFCDLAQEFIMSASLPSRFAPSPSQSRPRTEFVFEPLLDSDEAAQLLHIHPKTLQRMARNRQIHGIQVGKLWRFRASDLEGG
jgi:excisionase family DNA binding protein